MKGKCYAVINKEIRSSWCIQSVNGNKTGMLDVFSS